jgi:hypothetical protein
MALCYVAHAYSGDKKNIERAKKITKELQKRDLENCYICPLMAFSHLEYGEIGYDDEIELCLDLLTCADKLIVASEISKGVRIEIDFAKLVKMEVLRLEENGELRPFTE